MLRGIGDMERPQRLSVDENKRQILDEILL